MPGQEYRNTFNLASAAGQLITTVDKMQPARLLNGQALVALSPVRKLTAVCVQFSTAATQTVKVSIIGQGGTARPISSFDTVGATDYFFEPEHELAIGAGENFQVDVTATGAPAVTGTIAVFTDEA